MFVQTTNQLGNRSSGQGKLS